MTKKSTGIFVLGMHRSGTSLVSSLLHELGFAFDGPHLEPQPDNPRGYFEHREIVRIHDDFLEHLGRTWSDPRPFRPEDFSGKVADWIRERLREVLVKDFQSLPLWVLKDPRTSRLGALWDPLLSSEEVTPGYLVVVRSPAAVARSLAQREGFSTSKSLLLWLRHYLEAESWTRGKRRAWLLLDDIRRNARDSVLNGLRRLDIDDRIVPSFEDAALDGIFDPGLIHHESAGDYAGISSTAAPWVDSTWEALKNLAGEGREDEASATLDAVRASIGVADDLMMSDPAVWAVDSLRERADWVRFAVEETRDLVGQVFHGGGGYGELLAGIRSQVDSAANSMSSIHELLQTSEKPPTCDGTALAQAKADLGEAVSEFERLNRELTLEIQGLAGRNAAEIEILEKLRQIQQEVREGGEAFRGGLQQASAAAERAYERHAETHRRLDSTHSLTESALGAQLEGFENMLVSRDSRLARVLEEDVIGRLSNEITSVAEALGDRDEIINDYSAAVRTADRLRQERDRAVERVGAVEDSRIWKATAPLRAILDRLKGL